MERDNVDRLLSEFGAIIGITELALDENGFACLFFDDIGINIELDERNEYLYCYANVGDLPEDPGLTLCETLLEANLLFRLTGGGTLGIDKENKLVALVDTIPLSGLDLQTFEKRLGHFVKMTENWQNKINALTRSQEAGESDPITHPDLGIRA
jgi:hypothetical protein